MALPRSFYERGTVTVAKELLGKELVCGSRSGIIVETEAYTENDPASHSFHGMTKRNAPMFGKPGHAYVYFCYGMHWMFNVVTEHEGKAGAVLVRALEPVKNCTNTNGPAKLTKCMGIDRRFNGHDLTRKPLLICEGIKPRKIAAVPRIGIKDATEREWRFFIVGNRWVSK